jgi:hypothetical protein
MKRFLAILLLLSAISALAQPGQWSFSLSTDKDYYVALTTNDSNASLFKACFFDSKTCYWVIAGDTSCDAGTTTSVLINASQGAAMATLTCSPYQNFNRYILSNPDAMDDMAKAAGIIGFAIPLKSGQFKVYRFSLNGSWSVIQQMQISFWATLKNSTKNTTL